MKKQPGTPTDRCRRHALSLWLLLLPALPAAAQVGPLSYQSLFFDQAAMAQRGNFLAAQAGLVYTDNATFASGGSGTVLGEVGLVGNAGSAGPLFDYRLTSDISAVKYFDSAYRVEPSGYFIGTADLKVVPGVFTWTAQESYSQLLINQFAPATPDNLEGVNVITTGPRFTLRPTLRTTVTLNLLYSYVSTHSPSPLYVNIDDHRYGGDLKIERAFSTASSLYLKGSYQKVDFNDTAINNNFTVAEGVAGYKLQGARTVLDVSAGYTQLRQLDVPVAVESVAGAREHNETETYSAPTWKFNLSRLITPDQRVSLFAAQQLVDFATGFEQGFGQAVPTVPQAQFAVGAPSTNRTYGADWHFQASRTTIDVTLLDTSEHYRLTKANERDLIAPPQRVEYKDAGVMLVRRLNPALSWDIGVHFSHQSVTGPGSGSSNWTTALTSLRWQVGRRVMLRFLYGHSQFLGVRDDQVGVLVSYDLLGGGQPGGIGLGQGLPPLTPIAPTSMLPQP